MKLDRRSFLTAGLAAGAAGALPGVARAQFTRNFQTPLTIMVNAPLSGDGANRGLQIANGVQAAIDEANRMGGTFSTAFQMRPVDDQDALAQSMVNVQFGASDPTVVAMVGGYDGSLIAGSLQSYAQAQMPLMVPGSTADAITSRGYRNVFRLPTKDSTEGALAAQFIAQRDRPKMALAVTQDGDYGPDVLQGFLNQARASKMNADGYTFAYDKPDFAAAAGRIMSRNPDYVYLCGTAAALGPLIPALRAAGYKGKLGASEGFYDQATLGNYAADFADGVISTSFPPLDRAPDFANQLVDFRARSTVTALSAFAYAAAQIVMSAVRRVGATNRLATLSALQVPTPYTTIVGPFQFNYSGDPIDPLVYFYTVTGGRFKFIAPSHVTSFVL